MGFQILDASGKAISINLLDEEAAKFWGKEVKAKEYAYPQPEFTNPDNLTGLDLVKAKFRYQAWEIHNWFDIIGWAIAKQGGNWDEVRKYFDGCSTEGAFKPYFDLIAYWESKGYTPVKVS